MKKTIVLIDTMWKGHHPTYFKLYCQALVSLGCYIWAFCPNPDQIMDWLNKNYPEGLPFVKLVKYPDPTSLPIRALSRLLPPSKVKYVHAMHRWVAAGRMVKSLSLEYKCTPDVVFFNAIDYYYVLPGLPSGFVKRHFPYPWSGLYLSPRHLRVESKQILNPDKLFMLEQCKCVSVLDEGIKDKLSDRLKGKPVIAFPDITDSSAPDQEHPAIRDIRDKAKGRKIIGLIGNLARYQGVLGLLRVSKATADRDWFFLFAGPIERGTFTDDEWQEIQSSVRSGQNNCYFHIFPIADGSEFNALVAAVDVLFAVRENFPYSSNKLTKASIFRKPLIVEDGYLLAERVRKYGLGEVVQGDVVSDCISAIERLLLNSRENGNGPAIERRFNEYKELHSTERLRASFQELLAFY